MVDGSRHHFLARAGFSGDEHCAVGLGHALGTPDDFLHAAAASHDAVVVEVLGAFADEVLPLRPQALMFERVAHQREQCVHFERLLQVVESAELHGLDRALDGRVGCHQQHLRAFGLRELAHDIPDELEPGEPGHHVVGHEDVEGPGRELALGV